MCEKHLSERKQTVLLLDWQEKHKQPWIHNYDPLAAIKGFVFFYCRTKNKKMKRRCASCKHFFFAFCFLFQKYRRGHEGQKKNKTSEISSTSYFESKVNIKRQHFEDRVDLRRQYFGKKKEKRKCVLKKDKFWRKDNILVLVLHAGPVCLTDVNFNSVLLDIKSNSFTSVLQRPCCPVLKVANKILITTVSILFSIMTLLYTKNTHFFQQNFDFKLEIHDVLFFSTLLYKSVFETRGDAVVRNTVENYYNSFVCKYIP